ncbi:MAG: hypothetical protein Q4C98_09075 [Capnocytophaga sp.]|nr:hypothetical protein [Capnocytophaga sp.]
MNIIYKNTIKIINLSLLVMSLSVFAQKDNEEIEYLNYDKTQFRKIVFDKKNNPISVETYSIPIKFNPKPCYTGTYKDGKPYEGYFLVSDQSMEGLYDYYQYYEKGVLKKQYSYKLFGIDALEKSNNYTYKPLEFDAETTFENSKPKDGKVLYTDKEGSAAVISNIFYENFQPKEIFIDIYAMHYGNRIELKLKNDNHLEIKSAQNENVTYVLRKENDYITYDILNGKTKIPSPKVVNGLVKKPFTRIFFYNENGNLKVESILKEKVNDEDRQFGLLEILPLKNKQSIKDLFEKFATKFIVEKANKNTKEDKRTDEEIIKLIYGENGNNIVSTAYYDEDQKLEGGVISKKDNGFLLEIYYDDNKFFSKEFKNLNEINDEFIGKKLVEHINNKNK